LSDPIRLLTREVAVGCMDDLLAIDAGTDGERWGPEHFLSERPGKWVCSRWAVSEEGRPVGFAIASIKDDAVHVHRVAVDARHRRKGLGVALLRAVAEGGEKLRLARMTLKVSRTNEDAILFYRRLNFEDQHSANGSGTLTLGSSLQALASAAFPQGAERRPRLSGWAAFQQDIAKYQSRNGGGALKQVLTEQGLWALLQYRLDASVYRSGLPAPVKAIVRLPLIVWRKVVEVATGISIPCTGDIGPGLHLPHGGLRVFHSAAIVGSDCCITHGVTLGISGTGARRGAPQIGNRVYIGANAVIVGRIVVGDDAVVGANSLVNRDVPPHTTVLGVPAVVVSQRGSEEYL
jgi:serine O-acetyltransferase